MSAIKIKRVLQQVIGGTNQPIKLGGILENGSYDAVYATGVAATNVYIVGTFTYMTT